MVSAGKAGHTLGHKANLIAHRKVEVDSGILPDDDVIKLEIYTKPRRLSNSPKNDD